MGLIAYNSLSILAVRLIHQYLNMSFASLDNEDFVVTHNRRLQLGFMYIRPMPKSPVKYTATNHIVDAMHASIFRCSEEGILTPRPLQDKAGRYYSMQELPINETADEMTTSEGKLHPMT